MSLVWVSKSTAEFVILFLFLVLKATESQTIQGNQTETLRAATIVFRHGDRNPIQSYPGDPYANETYYWPEGFSAMTMRGKIRLYNLGRYMRRRYPTFQRKNVVVYSSQSNITITSAMSNLAGFYGQNRSFLKHVDTYNPLGFGITVIAKNDDDFIFMSQPCPNYLEQRQEFFKISQPMGQFTDAMEIINKHTGLNFSETSLEVVVLADTIIIQKSRNLKLPKWAEDLYEDGVFQEIQDSYFTNIMPTLQLKRLYTGAMINRFLEEMDKVISEAETTTDAWDSQTNFPKITVISGHDSTVASWLIDLEVFDWYGPPYGAALFLELYELTTDHKTFILKVFYKNDSESEPYQLSLPGCSNPCNYLDFKKLVQSFITKNRAQECGISQEIDETKSKNAKPHSSETIVSNNETSNSVKSTRLSFQGIALIFVLYALH